MSYKSLSQLLVFAFVACGAAFPSAALEPVDNSFAIKLRQIEDAKALLRICLSTEPVIPLRPALITVKGVKEESGGYIDAISGKFVNDPQALQGTFSTGSISLLDITDPAKAIKDIPYKVKLQLRGKGEERRVQSPYLVDGGLALCENSAEFDKALVTAFPKTYLIPKQWYSELSGWLTKRDFSFLVQPGKGQSPVELALRNEASPKFVDNGSAWETLAKGDFFVRCLAAARGLVESANFKSEVESGLNGSTPSSSVEAIAYGLLMGLKNGSIKNEDSYGLEIAIAKYYAAHPDLVASTGLVTILQRWSQPPR